MSALRELLLYNWKQSSLALTLLHECTSGSLNCRFFWRCISCVGLVKVERWNHHKCYYVCCWQKLSASSSPDIDIHLISTEIWFLLPLFNVLHTWLCFDRTNLDLSQYFDKYVTVLFSKIIQVSPQSCWTWHAQDSFADSFVVLVQGLVCYMKMNVE